jgi:glycosyltransferase involved in cell wall biosynthesis
MIKKYLKHLFSYGFFILALLKRLNKPKKLDVINIIGDVHSASGLGNTVRELVRSLNDLDLNIVNVPLSVGSKQNEGLEIVTSKNLKSGINIFVGTPELLRVALFKLKDPKLITNRNIGIWFWELNKAPSDWRRLNKVIDEIWVQSNYVKDAFKEADCPIALMPFSIDIKAINVINGNKSKKFTFLTSFDFLSFVTRKNPFATIEAYKAAFDFKDNSRLIIKCTNRESFPKAYKKIVELIKGREDIEIFDKYLSDQGFKELISSVDAYVSLHRSEGLGLNMAEAMMLGVPVIATGYSGNLNFMNVKNSYLVDFDLVPVPKGAYPYGYRCYWADAKIYDAIEKMRDVRFNLPDREEKVRNALDYLSVFNKENQRMSTGREPLQFLSGMQAPMIRSLSLAR